jgi:hypothetical protein
MRQPANQGRDDADGTGFPNHTSRVDHMIQIVGLGQTDAAMDVMVAEVAQQMGWFPLRGDFSLDTHPVYRTPRDSDSEEFGSLLRRPRP